MNSHSINNTLLSNNTSSDPNLFATDTGIQQFTSELLRMRHENSKTLASYKTLENDAQSLKSAFKNNIKLLAQRDSEIAGLNERMKQHQKQTVHTETKYLDLEKKHLEAGNEVTSLKGKLADQQLSEKRHELNLEKLVSKNVISGHETEKVHKLEMKQEIDKIKHKYTLELESSRKNLEEKIQNMTSDKKSSLEEIEVLKIRLKSEQNSLSLVSKSEADLSNKLKHLRQENSLQETAHHEEINRFQTALAGSDEILVQAESKILQIAKQFKIRLEKEKSQFKEEIDGYQQQVGDLMHENGRLGGLAKFKDLYDQLCLENVRLEKQGKEEGVRLEKYIEKARLSSVNYAKLESSFQHKAIEIEKITKKLHRVQIESSGLEGTIERMKSIMVQVGAFKNNISHTTTENLSGVENILDSNTTLQTKLREETIANQEHRKKIENLNNRINELNTEKENLTADSGKLTELIIKLKTEIQQAEKTNSKNKQSFVSPGLVLDSSKRDLVEKLSKAIETIEILSKENSRLVDLNNRGARNRKDSGGSSTRSMPVRNLGSSRRKNKFSMLENLGVELTKQDLRQVHKKQDGPSNQSKNDTPRTQKSIRSHQIANSSINIPETPGKESVLDSLAGGSDLWKPLNYRL